MLQLHCLVESRSICDHLGRRLWYHLLAMPEVANSSLSLPLRSRPPFWVCFSNKIKLLITDTIQVRLMIIIKITAVVQCSSSSKTPSRAEPAAIEACVELETEPEVVCLSECCACTGTTPTPFQPKDTAMTHHTWRQQDHLFSQGWYTTYMYQWLTMCCTRFHVLCIFCCFCVQNSLCSWLKKEDAFVTTGFDNRKKALEKFFFNSHSQNCTRNLLWRLSWWSKIAYQPF